MRYTTSSLELIRLLNGAIDPLLGKGLTLDLSDCFCIESREEGVAISASGKGQEVEVLLPPAEELMPPIIFPYKKIKSVLGRSSEVVLDIDPEALLMTIEGEGSYYSFQGASGSAYERSLLEKEANQEIELTCFAGLEVGIFADIKRDVGKACLEAVSLDVLAGEAAWTASEGHMIARCEHLLDVEDFWVNIPAGAVSVWRSLLHGEEKATLQIGLGWAGIKTASRAARAQVIAEPYPPMRKILHYPILSAVRFDRSRLIKALTAIESLASDELKALATIDKANFELVITLKEEGVQAEERIPVEVEEFSLELQETLFNPKYALSLLRRMQGADVNWQWGSQLLRFFSEECPLEMHLFRMIPRTTTASNSNSGD